VTHAWARPGFDTTAHGAPMSAELPWYCAAIVRGEVVALAHAIDDLPADATRERELVLAAGLRSHLTVPVALGGHFVCALSTSTFRHYCAWEEGLIDRFRLVGQILAHAIVRSRAPVRMPETRLRRLDAVERDYIRLVIDRCGGRINGRGHAAEILGLHPNTLRSRMKKLGILPRGRGAIRRAATPPVSSRRRSR